MILQTIPLGLIYGNPDQPRKTFAMPELLELRAKSPMRPKKPQDSLVGLGLFERSLL